MSLSPVRSFRTHKGASSSQQYARSSLLSRHPQQASFPPQSYVVSGFIGTITPSDSLSRSVGLRTQPYTNSLLRAPVRTGTRGSPQLTRCLSRHAIPDTPEEPRAVLACPTSRDTGFPAEIPGRPPQFGVYEATSRFTRVTACRFALPPLRDFVGSLRQRVLPLAPDPSLRG
jgi:hypothetical protein